MPSLSKRQQRRRAVRQKITALERALAAAERQLHEDDLTALLNRRGFRRACDRWAADGPAAAACCVMIDLDGFKAINDRHGHPAGDAALVHFAAVLRAHTRPVDTVARLGGDEFALILAHCRAADAVTLLARLQHTLTASPLPMPAGTVALRFSAGIAEHRPGESLAQALIRADAALLDAKRHGKASVGNAGTPASTPTVLPINLSAECQPPAGRDAGLGSPPNAKGPAAPTVAATDFLDP